MDFTYFYQKDELGQVVTEEGAPQWRSPSPTSSRARVEAVLAQGKQAAARAHAAAAIDTEQWTWLDAYQAWQAQGEALAAKEPERARGDAGEYLADDPDTAADEAWVDGYSPEIHQAALAVHAATEPVRPALLSVEDYLAGCAGYISLEQRAKAERLRLCEADITVHGVSWQVDATSRDHLRSAIETAEREGMAQDTTQPWILADNSLFEATAAQLGAVLSAYSLRMGQVFSAYTDWRNGPRDEAFTL